MAEEDRYMLLRRIGGAGKEVGGAGLSSQGASLVQIVAILSRPWIRGPLSSKEARPGLLASKLASLSPPVAP